MRNLSSGGRLFAVCAVGLFVAWRPLAAGAQVDMWRLGAGGTSWNTVADVQVGAVTEAGGLQPVQIPPGVNLTRLLAQSGLQWQSGPPENFMVGGLPHAWSNSAYFNQIKGPLLLVDGDATTSTGSVFKSSGNPAGTAFFLDLGTRYPVNRIRFYPPESDPDAYVRAYELTTSNGDDFDPTRRPNYTLVSRVESNRDITVDFEFETTVVRFVQVKNLSKTPFSLAEIEVYGDGFVSESTYRTKLHKFDVPSNFGMLRVGATRLGEGTKPGDEPPQVTIRLRTGTDDSPVSYFRRDRATGDEEEVSQNEYEKLLPRLAYFRVDPVTGTETEVETRTDYLALPTDEQGPVRDFVQGGIREDAEHWSPWSVPVVLDSTQSIAVDLGLDGPRQYIQLAADFTGDSRNAMRLDSLSLDVSPLLVSQAVGEVALASTPTPREGVTQVEVGVDTVFTCDIDAQFTQAGLPGFDGVRITSFPAPQFEGLEIGDPPVAVTPVSVESREDGFDVRFPAMDARNVEPLRVLYRQSVLEHSTVVRAWLLKLGGGLPQPVAAGNARDNVGTNSLLVYTMDPRPSVEVTLSTAVITPNGDGADDVVRIGYRLMEFSGDVQVDVQIFDLAGRRVRRLVDARSGTGEFSATWDGCTADGSTVPPGNYICYVEVHAQARTFKTARVVGVAY